MSLVLLWCTHLNDYADTAINQGREGGGREGGKEEKREGGREGKDGEREGAREGGRREDGGRGGTEGGREGWCKIGPNSHGLYVHVHLLCTVTLVLST